MFTKTVEATRICAPALDKIFSNIRCDEYRSDYALKTLARILLGERVSEEVVSFVHKHDVPFEEAAADHTVTFCTAMGKEKFDTYSQKAKGACYEKNERLDSYFRSFRFGLWCNREMKSTVILYEYGGIQIYHNILSAFKWFVPWYFEGEQGLTSAEIAMLETFTVLDGADEFIRLANEYYGKRDYRKQILRSQLEGAEKRYKQQEANVLSRKIDECRRAVESHQEQINHCLREMRAHEIRRLGLLYEDGEQDDRILNMFIHYKNLFLEGVDNYGIRYTVRAKATNIDREMYRQCTRSKESYIYGYTNVNYELAKRVLDAIFWEKRYTVYLFGAYELRFDGYVELRSNGEMKEASETALPNPHVFYHSCAGSFASDLSSAMMEGDFEGAIEVTIAETANINFGDSVPVKNFIRDFFINRKDKKCIETGEGKMITPAELICRMKEEMEHEAAEVHAEG